MRRNSIPTLSLATITIFSFFAFQLSSAQKNTSPNQPPSSAEGFRIAGTVVSKIDSHALSQARITIRDPRDSQKFQFIITADDGKFEFNGLPAGKYSLIGARRWFISAAYDQHDGYSTAIVTGAGLDTENLTLRLAPNAVIAGRVLDEAGEPVRHANVSLYYDDHSNGIDRIHQIRPAITDDQGSYEFTPLRPGTYFVSASAKPWYAVHFPVQEKSAQDSASSVDRSLDVAYPTTFYADVTDADSATPIPVRGGDRLQVDIHMTPVQAISLRFRVPDNGTHGFAPPRLQQPVFDGSTPIEARDTQQISPGLMEISGIAAGRYDVHLEGKDGWLQMDGVDLTKDGEEIDTSHAEPLSTVKVTVAVPGEAKVPMLGIGLRSKNKLLSGLQIVDGKGEVEFAQVPAGSYEVVAGASTTRYSVAHMMAEGGAVSGHRLTIAPGSSVAVSLTLVAGHVEVEGTVKKAGHPFAGAMVVLVPKNPEADRDLFRRDQSDLDGTFSLRDVIPGSYTLLAIENGWDLDWSEPGVISAYLKRGRKIQVGDQAGHPMTTEAIEVQSE